MELRVIDRKNRDLGRFSLPDNATVADLKRAFAAKKAKYYPSRQYYTIGTDASKVVLNPLDAPLSNFALKSGDTVVFKDLGPQISWKTVFHVEYFGPILVHALFYFLPALFYPGYSASKYTHSFTQTVAFWCVIVHYAKREYETHFIHRFSNDTMPLLNIFKNSFHYWIIGGAMIAYFLYHPLYTPPFSDAVVTVSAVIFLLMEVGNFLAHVTLRNLRPAGTRTRANPRGGLFELVSCANYTYELGAWLVFAIFTQTLTAYIFFGISFAQITEWALKKHRAYKKEFAGEPRGRKALIPFLL